MKRLNQSLIVLFAIQLMVAGGLYIAKGSSNTEGSQAMLINVNNSDIDHISIEDGEGNQIFLKKISDTWQLPNYHQLPANENKVTSLLDKLSTLKTGWPVATTTAGQERFEVTEEKYQRRLKLAKGSKMLEAIYLGTSPGFKKVHTRKAKEDKVYALALNAFDFPTKNKEWFDRALIRPEGSIAELKGPDFYLSKSDEKWTFQNQEDEVAQEEAEKLKNTLIFLQVEEAEDTEGFDTDRDYRLTLTTEGKESEYHFFEHDEKHYLRHPDYVVSFKISKHDYEKITDFNLTKLMTKEGKAEENLRPEEMGKMLQGTQDRNS